MRPHSPVSSVDARCSSAAWVAHCRLPRAPSAGVLSASWRPRQSCLRRTRIPCGSPQTTPPLLSNPTSPSAAGSRPHQSTHSFKRVGQNKLPNWATSEYRNHTSSYPISRQLTGKLYRRHRERGNWPAALCKRTHLGEAQRCSGWKIEHAYLTSTLSEIMSLFRQLVILPLT